MRITRLVIIVNLLRRKIYPSIQTIRQKLNDRDIDITDRTIKRDINVLKDWLQISVKYDRNRKGYYIDEEETLHLDQTHRVLEELDSGRRSFSPPDTYIYNHVHTIEVNKLYSKGFDHIEPNVDAIRTKKCFESPTPDETGTFEVNCWLRPSITKSWEQITGSEV